MRRSWSTSIITTVLIAASLVVLTRVDATVGTSPSLLTQQGYVWENDDQTSAGTVDSATQQAAGSTAITGVAIGERLTLRTQITNSGAALSGVGAGLFYDRNDGIFTKVRTNPVATTSTGSCTDTNFNCTVVDSSGMGEQTAVAIDSSGNPWIAYRDITNTALKVAHYVSSGGNCGTSSAWRCDTVDSTSVGLAIATGSHVAMGIYGDAVWLAYYSSAVAGIIVAKYVGSGGTCGTSTAWSCGVMDWAYSGQGNGQSSIAFDSSGNPWIAYVQPNNDRFRVAHYVGSGGTGCDTTGVSNTTWSAKFTCTEIGASPANNTGKDLSIGVDASNVPWVSFWNYADGRLRVAKYVTSSGTGCTTTAWTCYDIDSGGQYTSMAFDPSGNPWISYTSSTTTLRVAQYVGSGGANCGYSSAWSCSTADNNASTGQYTSMAFDPAGQAWISEYAPTAKTLKLSRYVGSSGSGCGSGVTAWKCTTVDSSATDVGSYTSLAFAPDGTAWISYVDATNTSVKAAWLNRGGEITVAAGTSGNANGASVNKSHADMTTTSDTINKTDADCLAASTTWNNGLWFTSETGNGLSLPTGSTTKQCTEVAFVLSTAQAQASTTYRFVLATNDGWRADRQLWRGPATISAYPTLTTTSAGSTKYSKDTLPSGSTTCTDSNWICATVDNGANVGNPSSIAFDATGTPWIAYVDATNSSLKWAKRVSSGGTGCFSATWNCSTIDSAAGHTFSGGNQLALQFDDSGTAWVAYYDSNASYKDLRVAKYVGSGGSGCATGVTSWTCTSVDTPNDVGSYLSMAIDRSGAPWIAYYDATNTALRIAHYVGSGGTGCTASAWTCTAIVTANSSGTWSSIAIDRQGSPWVAYRIATGTKLGVARYLGVGATSTTNGCNAGGWSCYSVDTTGNTGTYTSITFDGSGSAYVGYYDTTNTKLRMAKFVGSGGGSGAGCGASSSTAWSCTTLDNTVANIGTFTSMATDSSGAPWIVYKDVTNSNRMVAHYVGSGGTGCASGVTSWTCGVLNQAGGGATYGGQPSIAIDSSGAPWISHYDATSGYLLLDKLLLPSTGLAANSSISGIGGTNARTGGERYSSDAGESPRGSCAATVSARGACGVATLDGSYDSMTSPSYERPSFAMMASSASNASFPSYRWVGMSTTTNTVTLQVYRYGTTNGWVTLSSAAASTSADVSITGTASAGSASEYWQSDGSRYWTSFRVYQGASTSGSETLLTNYFGSNLPPSTPASLGQANGSTITTGSWTNGTTVTFSANVSDQDTSDTDSLCVEVQPLGNAFTNAPTCGSGVAYSGSAVAATVSVGSLTNGTRYHWQAQVKDSGNQYSSWTSYGGNAESAADFGIDTSAPTTGTVYDGSSAGVESSYNNGSLTTLSGNWSGFADASSGIASYDYSIGTSAGGTDIKAWTSTASTSFTASGLSLRTNQRYYVNVRAIDNVGLTSSVVSSAGQLVAPTLTFTTSANQLTLGPLGASSSYTATSALTISITTNAYSGYQVTQSASGALTYNGSTVGMYSGTWATPTTWSGTGFGYTSSDTSVSGSNRFSGATKYAGLSTSSPGDTIADSSSAAPSTDSYTVTYKLAVPSTQAAGTYRTSLVLQCVASY